MVANWYDCDGEMIGSATFPKDAYQHRYGGSVNAVLCDIRASHAREVELWLLPDTVDAALLREVLLKMLRVSIRYTQNKVVNQVLCDVLSDSHCLIARLDMPSVDIDQETLDAAFAANTSLREIRLLSDNHLECPINCVSAVAKNTTIKTVVWRGNVDLTDEDTLLLRAMPSLTLVNADSFPIHRLNDGWDNMQHSWFDGCRRSPDIVPYDYRNNLKRRETNAFFMIYS
jgi:hypothetical protein